jgi:hypothetical protein
MLPTLTFTAIPTSMDVDLTIRITAAANVNMIIITTATAILAATFMDKAAAIQAYTVVADIDEGQVVKT